MPYKDQLKRKIHYYVKKKHVNINTRKTQQCTDQGAGPSGLQCLVGSNQNVDINRDFVAKNNFENYTPNQELNVESHCESHIYEPLVVTGQSAEESVELLVQCPKEGHKENENICQNLRLWFFSNSVTITAFRNLLRSLNNSNINVPLDPRTILKTPRSIDKIQQICGGLYYYFGIEHSINNLVLKHNITISNELKFSLSVNIDGLPLSHSSNSEFWPILCQIISIRELKGCIFPVALYHGHQKLQNANVFLKDFVNEANLLITNKISIQNFKCKFEISMIIADTPAKSFILSIKGHSGYFSCTKCVTEGDMCNKIMTFTELTAPLRTDIDFREHRQKEHHIDDTILQHIKEFDIIDNIPIDYMHCILLGVTKRLICHQKFGFVFGKPPHKLRHSDVEKINNRLNSFNCFIPKEFARKCRSLSESKRYKATEFRLFLLYTGIVALQGILPSKQYYNFLMLSVATSLFCNKYLCQDKTYKEYADQLMRCFIHQSIKIYGASFVSHNVHNLIHLKDCVALYGNLDNFSAFPFENYMQKLKKTVHKHNQPLQQVIKRTLEEENFFLPESYKIPDAQGKSVKFLIEHKSGLLLSNCQSPQYKRMICEHFIINIDKKADRFVQMRDKRIVEIKNFVTFNSEVVAIGNDCLTSDFFNKPVASSKIDIYLIMGYKNKNSELFHVENILRKVVVLPFKNQFVCIPFLH